MKNERNILSAEPFPVVGIGASAGGLEAISNLLQHLKPDLGMAYVIVQHLSSDHKSLLPELLQRRTSMTVHEVTEGIKIQPDNIYVIPPANYMSITDGHLSLAHRGKDDKEYRIIDFFLETLAPVYQNNAIAVILSGVGSDGTMGVQAIKAEGGITFAQDDSALFHSMARNAYESGYVDIIQSPEGIAGELAILAKQNYAQLPPNKDLPIDEKQIKKIETLIYNHCGVDFSNYKRTTIHRRILRRMALKRLNNLEEYIKVLKDTPAETELLYRDLLINVTYFFREPELFTTLSKKIYPELIKNRRPDDPIRIWIPACSSGEEAYSMAITLFEFFGEKVISTPIQIFATDLSDSAIERARHGTYSKSALQNVSPQRIKQFFTRTDISYQIIKPIRDVCIFASHNLLKDPPFSRMDLISCQNVMIYLAQGAQKKILQAFHYALKPSCYLVLGKSESIGSETDFFEPVDKEHKIYQKKSIAAGMQFDFFSRFQPPANHTQTQKFNAPQSSETGIEKESDRILLSRYVPASVVINSDLQILRFHGPINNYLQPASGKASLHLLKMVRNELVFELRGMISKAQKEKQPVKKEGLALTENGFDKQVDIEIIPIKSSGEDPFFLIVFLENFNNNISFPAGEKNTDSEDVKTRRIEALQLELREAREHTKSMNEDFEATREELQSANEEVLSSNEELQSINEELETSTEELQSTNEELTTINDELQLRTLDLKKSSEYTKQIMERLRLVIESAREYAIFTLSTTGLIDSWSPGAENIYGYSEKEIIGQPSAILYTNEDRYQDIPSKEIREALENGSASDERWHLRKNGSKFFASGVMSRINDDKKSGLVKICRDLTERKLIEQHKDEFIGVASHELKTPVTTIKAYSELLEETLRNSDDSDATMLVRRLNQQVERLTSLVTDLLDVTRISEGQLQMNKEQFDLNELIAKCVEEVKFLHARQDIVHEVVHDGIIFSDKRRVEQVIANFLSNAVKYSVENGKIVVRTEKNDGKIIVSVTDFGIGMSEEISRQAFERFYRADGQANESLPGLGLGLFIASSIVKKLGGDIWVKSEQGKGATFSFSLPLAG